MASGHAVIPFWVVCVAFLPGAVSSQTQRAAWRNWIPWESYWKEEAEAVARLIPQSVVRRFALPVDGTIEQRALFFKNQVSRWSECPAQASIAVIAHSQSGLDARYARQALRMRRLQMLLTVGTPHQGAELAQWAVAQRDDQSLWARLLRGVGYDLRQVPFLDQLVPGFVLGYAAAFAEPKDFERAGFIAADCSSSGSCGWLFDAARFVTGVKEWGGGDGLVTLASQRWGKEWGSVKLNHRDEARAQAGEAGERAELLGGIVRFLRGEARSDGR